MRISRAGCSVLHQSHHNYTSPDHLCAGLSGSGAQEEAGRDGMRSAVERKRAPRGRLQRVRAPSAPRMGSRVQVSPVLRLIAASSSRGSASVACVLRDFPSISLPSIARTCAIIRRRASHVEATSRPRTTSEIPAASPALPELTIHWHGTGHTNPWWLHPACIHKLSLLHHTQS
jgi:hypothetical protein